jgi:hypothetical protein
MIIFRLLMEGYGAGFRSGPVKIIKDLDPGETNQEQ